MTRPMPIPIAPPTRSPSSHTSMLCAQPSACSSVRVRSSVSVSQRGSRPVRHSSATWPNLALAVVRTSLRLSHFLVLRPRWTWPTLITGLGSGDHHATQYGSSRPLPTRPIVPSATRPEYRTSLIVRKRSSAAGSGKIPRRYAPSTLAGLRSAQNATGPSSDRLDGPDGADGADGAISSDSQSG